jgi:hypothetical protein
MTALPKYYPLDRPLQFQARVSVTERDHFRTTDTALVYGLSLQPAAKQGWRDYCLQIDRTESRYENRSANPADEVVFALAAPLRQVELLLDAQGAPTRLRNHAAIWQHWKETTRPAVLSAYSGPWVEAMVGKAERSLLHPESVVDALMGNDWVLQQYFAGMRRAADSSPFRFRLAGRPVQIPEKWQAAGAQEFSIEGGIAGKEGSLHWNSLLPPAQRKDHPVEPPVITKRGSYRLLPGSLWCAGFDCSYAISFGSRYEKHIQLQLSPQ